MLHGILHTLCKISASFFAVRPRTMPTASAGSLHLQLSCFSVIVLWATTPVPVQCPLSHGIYSCI